MTYKQSRDLPKISAEVVTHFSPILPEKAMLLLFFNSDWATRPLRWYWISLYFWFTESRY